MSLVPLLLQLGQFSFASGPWLPLLSHKPVCGLESNQPVLGLDKGEGCQ